MMSICMGSVVGGVVTDMVGDIGTGVVVVAYWTRAVGGVHSMVTVELSLPFTTFTTLTSAGAGSERKHHTNNTFGREFGLKSVSMLEPSCKQGLSDIT